MADNRRYPWDNFYPFISPSCPDCNYPLRSIAGDDELHGSPPLFWCMCGSVYTIEGGDRVGRKLRLNLSGIQETDW